MGDNSNRLIKVGERWNGSAVTPQIRLSGKWLEDADIKQGDYLDIVIERNKLTINRIRLPF